MMAVMKRYYVFLVLACFFVSFSGCGPKDEQIVDVDQAESVVLKENFKVGDVATYRVITEEEQSLEYEGFEPGDVELSNKKDLDRVEMVFERKVESVTEDGNAVAMITVKELKYQAVRKNNVLLDFDSTRKADAVIPMNNLIGLSYKITLNTSGQVSGEIDSMAAIRAVRGTSPAHKATLALLRPKAIKDRHSLAGLAELDKVQVSQGDSWSNEKVVNFPIIGKKSYERVYSLKAISEKDTQKFAEIKMEAIPSAESEGGADQAVMSMFLKKLDKVGAYEGQIKFDVNAGKVVFYTEKLDSEWVMVDPNPKEGKEPAMVKMGAVRFHSIEKLD